MNDEKAPRNLKQLQFLLPVLLLWWAGSPPALPAEATNQISAELYLVVKTTTIIATFRPTPQYDHHDPSNIMRHEDRDELDF